MFESTLLTHKSLHKYKEKLKTLEHICDLCGQKFVTLLGFKEHKLSMHRTPDSKDFICEICKYLTTTAKKLQIHKYNKHAVERHKNCPYCKFKSPSTQKIHQHIDRNHPETGKKELFCEKCGKGFIFKESLKDHLWRCGENAIRGQIRSCPNCDFVTKDSRKLKKHKKEGCNASTQVSIQMVVVFHSDS